jgi:hypothetical protein
MIGGGVAASTDGASLVGDEFEHAVATKAAPKRTDSSLHIA